MKRFNQTAAALGICCFSMAGPVTYASNCSAEAKAGNNWISDNGLQINIQFHVRGGGDDEPHRGFVTFRVHYAQGDRTSDEKSLVEYHIAKGERRTDVTGTIRSMDKFTSVFSVDVEDVSCN